MFRLFGTLPFNIDPQRNIWLSDQEGICKGRLIWKIGFSFFVFFFVNEQTLTTGPLHLLFFLNALPSDILKAPSCLTILLYSHCPFLPWSSCKNSTPLTHILHFLVLTYFFYATYYHETYHIFIWVPSSLLGCKHHEIREWLYPLLSAQCVKQ